MIAIIEPERKTPVAKETDVIVVGGGTAGVIAAIAARRTGADTLLIERYGYLGGMITGSYVTAMIGFSTKHGSKQMIRGISQEFIGRLTEAGGCTPLEGWGPYDVHADAEIYKWVAIKMLEEAGVQLLFHSWVVDVVTEGNSLKGVIVENKSGRQAIMGKVTVDATGDGDIAKFAGAPYETGRHPWGITLITVIEGVDRKKADRFRKENPRKFKELMEELKAKGGNPNMSISLDLDPLNVNDLTKAEVEMRKRTMLSLAFFKEHVPGYESARVRLTSPQIGVRESRRIVGEYMLTNEDVERERKFTDTILRVPLLTKEGSFDVPYRCLLPLRVDNLLVAGRCVSVKHEALDHVRPIAPCMGLGHAAGTAAALAVKQNVRPRNLDISLLQRTLMEQGANLGPN